MKSGLGLEQKELRVAFTSVQCDHAQRLRGKGGILGDAFSSLVPVVQGLECDSKSKRGKGIPSLFFPIISLCAVPTI